MLSLWQGLGSSVAERLRGDVPRQSGAGMEASLPTNTRGNRRMLACALECVCVCVCVCGCVCVCVWGLSMAGAGVLSAWNEES